MRDANEGEPGGKGRITVRVTGDLDLSTAPSVLEVIRAAAAAASPTSEVLVDMHDVGFVDSSGLSVLIQARNQLHATGVHLQLVNPTRQLLGLMQITGMSTDLQPGDVSA